MAAAQGLVLFQQSRPLGLIFQDNFLRDTPGHFVCNNLSSYEFSALESEKMIGFLPPSHSKCHEQTSPAEGCLGYNTVTSIPDRDSCLYAGCGQSCDIVGSEDHQQRNMKLELCKTRKPWFCQIRESSFPVGVSVLSSAKSGAQSTGRQCMIQTSPVEEGDGSEDSFCPYSNAIVCISFLQGKQSEHKICSWPLHAYSEKGLAQGANLLFISYKTHEFCLSKNLCDLSCQVF